MSELTDRARAIRRSASRLGLGLAGFVAAARGGARTADNVPEIGRKLDYAFGRASGSRHNIARSTGMQRQLARIGIHDIPAGRAELAEHSGKVLRDQSNIARTEANGRLVRESLLMGPRGGLQVESIWEGSRLITFKMFGAGG